MYSARPWCRQCIVFQFPSKVPKGSSVTTCQTNGGVGQTATKFPNRKALWAGIGITIVGTHPAQIHMEVIIREFSRQEVIDRRLKRSELPVSKGTGHGFIRPQGLCIVPYNVAGLSRVSTRPQGPPPVDQGVRIYLLLDELATIIDG